MNDLTLICQGCQQPIEGDTGCIYLLFGDLHEARRATEEWREAHPPGTAVDIVEFLTMPAEAHWRTAHFACRSEEHRDDCYQIDSERITSWQRLCWWSAHLMEKNWFGDTDWDQLLRDLGDGHQGRIVASLRSVA